MSKYIKLATGEVKSQGEWRAANKHISLPKVWKEATLASLGLQAVLASPKPSATELQHVLADGTEIDAKGNVVESWKVVDKFSDTTDEEGVVTTKAEHEAAHLAKVKAEADEAAIKKIEAEYSEAVKAITAGYTDDEIKTWDKQLGEAAAFTADATAPTPLLDALTGATGDAKADLVGKVISKANAYSAAVGEALGKKQKAIKDLGAAK